MPLTLAGSAADSTLFTQKRYCTVLSKSLRGSFMKREAPSIASMIRTFAVQGSVAAEGWSLCTGTALEM